MSATADLPDAPRAAYLGVPREMLPLDEKIRRLENRVKILENFLGRVDDRNTAVVTIKRLVAERYGLTVRVLSSRQRPEHIVWPRNICIYLLDKLCGHSTPFLAEHFGRRDRKTISHSLTQMHNRLCTDVRFQHEIAAIEALALQRLATITP
jgi:chromosomal replication initiation ATPase DnaA